MREKYAELLLYHGSCPVDGNIGEGRFDLQDMRPEAISLRQRATDNIKKYLTPGYEWGLAVIGLPSERVVSSELDAKKMVCYIEDNVPNFQVLITPVLSMHGRIQFSRKVRFSDIMLLEKESFISKLKSSGHLPYTREEAEKDGWFGEDIEEIMTRENNKRWNNSLRFY